MRSTLLVVTVFCLGSLAFGGGEGDSKLLQGDWVPVEAELAGAPFPDEVRKTIKLNISGDKYTVTVGKTVDRGTTKIDATKKPKTMDITSTEGANDGKTFQAIYEVNQTTLRVCYDLTGKTRPTEFKTMKDAQHFLVTYKRPK